MFVFKQQQNLGQRSDDSNMHLHASHQVALTAVNSKAVVLLLLVHYLSRDMRFLTMWYVRPANTQTSLHIRTV